MSIDDEEARITLRLPASLRDALAERADENKRSMNAEIVLRLEESVWLDKTGVRSKGEMTVHDLIQPVNGEHLVKSARALEDMARKMLSVLDAEEGRELRESARDYLQREREAKGAGENSEEEPR